MHQLLVGDGADDDAPTGLAARREELFDTGYRLRLLRGSLFGDGEYRLSGLTVSPMDSGVVELERCAN